jgi:hypothetical protein
MNHKCSLSMYCVLPLSTEGWKFKFLQAYQGISKITLLPLQQDFLSGKKIVHSRNLTDWSHGTFSNVATWNHLGAPAPAYSIHWLEFQVFMDKFQMLKLHLFGRREYSLYKSLYQRDQSCSQFLQPSYSTFFRGVI